MRRTVLGTVVASGCACAAVVAVSGRAHALACVPPPQWSLPSPVESALGDEPPVAPEVPPNVKLWRSDLTEFALFDADAEAVALSRLTSQADAGVVDTEDWEEDSEEDDAASATFYVYSAELLEPGPYFMDSASGEPAFVVVGEPDVEPPAVPSVDDVRYDVHYEVLEFDDDDGITTESVEVVLARLELREQAALVVFRQSGSGVDPLDASVLLPGYGFIGYDWCFGSEHRVEAVVRS